VGYIEIGFLVKSTYFPAPEAGDTKSFWNLSSKSKLGS